MVYKFLSSILSVLLIVLVCLYAFEKHKNSNLEDKISNSTPQVLTKDSNTLYTSNAAEVKNLQDSLSQVQLENKDLAEQIKKKDSQVISLTQINLSLKDQLFKINSAKQSYQDLNGQKLDPEKVDSACQKISERVDFDQTQDNVRVQGFTLTNPAYAELHLSYKPLKLNVIVSQTRDHKFKVYADTDPQIQLNDINVKFEPIEQHWYEKISVEAQAGASANTAISSFSLKCDVSNFTIGPTMFMIFDDSGLHRLYGANIGWYPFKD